MTVNFASITDGYELLLSDLLVTGPGETHLGGRLPLIDDIDSALPSE
jgi:hypothetical protein